MTGFLTTRGKVEYKEEANLSLGCYGNMTSDGRFSYVWNAENRLVRAQELYAPTNRAPYTVTYAYDHRGRMVSKRIYDSALKTLALPNHPTTQPPSGGCVCRVIGISGGGRAAFIGISRRVILRLRRNSGYPGLSEAPKSRRDNPIPRYPELPRAKRKSLRPMRPLRLHII